MITRTDFRSIPEFLTDEVIKKAESGETTVVEKAEEEKEFIDHSFGVLEDSHTGEIWYKEGDSIYRANDEFAGEDEVVRRFMKKEEK